MWGATFGIPQSPTSNEHLRNRHATLTSRAVPPPRSPRQSGCSQHRGWTLRSQGQSSNPARVRMRMGGFLQWSQRVDFDDDGTNVCGACLGDDQPAREARRARCVRDLGSPLLASMAISAPPFLGPPPETTRQPPTTAWTRADRGEPVIRGYDGHVHPRITLGSVGLSEAQH